MAAIDLDLYDNSTDLSQPPPNVEGAFTGVKPPAPPRPKSNPPRWSRYTSPGYQPPAPPPGGTTPPPGGTTPPPPVNTDFAAFISRLFPWINPTGNTGITGYSNQPGGTTPPPPVNTDPGAFISSLLQGLPYGPEHLRSIQPQLEAAGYTLHIDSSNKVRGRISDPFRQSWDVTDPREGPDWWTNPVGTQWGAPRSAGNQFGGGGGFDGYFSDPLLSQYLSFGQDAISQLMGPQQTNPVLQDAINKLTSVFNAGDPGYGVFKPFVDQRLAELEQPAWSDQRRQLAQTSFYEPLESQRAAQQQNALRRASSRGIGLSSGVLEDEARGIDRSFDQARTVGDRGLVLAEMDAETLRGQEAAGLGQALASLAGRNVPSQLSAAGQLAGIGSQMQSEPIQRLMQALGVSQNLAKLPGQQMSEMANVYSILNSQRVPQADQTGGLISLLMALAGQGEDVYGNTMNQEGDFWQNLFAALPGLVGSFGSGRPDDVGREPPPRRTP